MRLNLTAILATVVVCLLAVSAAAEPAPERFSRAQVLADFEQLYQQLQISHVDLYARRDKAAYQAQFERIRRSIDRPMSAFEAQKLFQRFVAYGRIAHARIEFPAAEFERFRAEHGKVFPLMLRPFGNKILVTKNLSARPELVPGTEILGVNGVPAARWLQRLGQHISADNDYLLYVLLEQQMPAYVWLEHGAQEHFTLEIRSAAGKREQLLLAARNRAQMQRAQAKQASGPALDWTDRSAGMRSPGLAYLRIGAFFDVKGKGADIWRTEEFAAFITESFARFRREGARTLLIDLRNNPGGDNSFSDLLLQQFATRPFQFASRFRVKVSQAAIESNAARLSAGGDDSSASAQLARQYQGKKLGEIYDFQIDGARPLPSQQRFPGKVFILINRKSFSNAVIVAAMSQDYGFATILGEETADLASTYGAMEQFVLRHTAITVGFPKAQIIRVSGDRSARGVIPDVTISTPLIETAQDSVLQAAIAIATQPSGGM